MEDERFRPPEDLGRARAADPWWGVHAARYAWAAANVDADLIVDVACGAGYGLHLLDGPTRTVVGVDGDPAAAAIAGAHGIVVAAHAVRLPFPDRSLRVVTSFETIEHLHDRRAFVEEIARVLRPEGRLLLSTPNAHHTRPVDGVPRNPYHVHEYTPDELAAELGQRFGSVELLGQTCSPAFRTPAFQDEQRMLDRSLPVQARLLAWRVTNKLPMEARELVGRVILRRSGFYPGEHDYRFTTDTVSTAPVTVAVCERPITG